MRQKNQWGRFHVTPLFAKKHNFIPKFLCICKRITQIFSFLGGRLILFELPSGSELSEIKLVATSVSIQPNHPIKGGDRFNATPSNQKVENEAAYAIYTVRDKTLRGLLAEKYLGYLIRH